MTVTYKEALADAKKLREVAEQNAKKAIMEQIAPTVKDMIEKELLGEACSDMEEDVLISPDDRDDDKDDDKEEMDESEQSDEVTLTTESVQALAQMAGAKAEHYGVRALRISDKIEKLHEAKVNENTYGEKLRQIKNEIEKTFKALQEDKKNNIVPSESAQLIEGKLEESWEVTNKLMIPVKVRLINESNTRIAKKIGQFKMIAEDYGLTKEAKNRFGKECIKLTKETKALFDSVAELKEVVEDSTVDKVQNKITGLFKEIYTMAKKFGSLNEEELKIVISGLDTEDPEGSALSAMVEPGDELGDDDLEGGDDMDMDDMDMDDMDMGDEMEEMGMYETDALAELTGLEEEALDELLGGKSGGTYSAGKGGLGKTRRGGARRHLSPEERAAQEKRGAELAAKEKEQYGESEVTEGDEMLEISEAMLKQELLRLKRRRAAMNEAMKAMQHSPGGGPGALDNFGGAGRQLGGGVECDMFEDYGSDDLNDLDPVGTGFPVNESEEALDELLGGQTYKAGKGGLGKTRRGGARRSLSPEERAAQEKRGSDLAAKEKAARERGEIDEAIETELAETVQTYEGALKKMRSDYGKLEEELRKSNLSNAKLVYATKLMQNENLSEKQRLVVVEQLDKAKSVREVKKLFTALKEALTGDKKGKLTESVADRKILGGSSKAAKPGSTLTESENKEFTRWGELAGFLNE